MSLDHIRHAYHVPAKRGQQVLIDGHPGRIVGARGARLRVRFDHGPLVTCHPTWRVEYQTEVKA